MSTARLPGPAVLRQMTAFNDALELLRRVGEDPIYPTQSASMVSSSYAVRSSDSSETESSKFKKKRITTHYAADTDWHWLNDWRQHKRYGDMLSQQPLQ